MSVVYSQAFLRSTLIPAPKRCFSGSSAHSVKELSLTCESTARHLSRNMMNQRQLNGWMFPQGGLVLSLKLRRPSYCSPDSKI